MTVYLVVGICHSQPEELKQQEQVVSNFIAKIYTQLGFKNNIPPEFSRNIL